MNAWTGLFQSVHSALIDELTERHPEPKPELGMPIRESVYRVPDPSLNSILVAEVELVGQRGILFLATEPGFNKGTRIQSQAFWDAILKRAETEFERREIHPVFTRPVTLMATSPLPSHFPAIGRVVWIPFRIPSGRCHLGLGV